MFLSKTRIIGLALGIILLACLMDKELYGYNPSFHEMMADVTIEMMIVGYPSLPQQYLRSGSTQPDRDRKKFQQTPNIDIAKVIRDNKEHKRDTTRINRNYVAAIENYKRFAGGGKQGEGINQGMRILAKAFHYVSDQTEPEESRGFSNLMGREFRGIVQNMLQAIMANDKAKKHFFDKVNRLYQQYQFNPRDEKFVSKEITGIRGGLEEKIREILARPNLNRDKAIQKVAKDDINRLIWDYLALIVAIQNLMLEQFVKETQIESGAFPTPGPPVQPQPPQQTRPPTPTGPPPCQKVCVQEQVVWLNVTDGRHSLCAGGVARPPGPGLPPPKCERSVRCIKWETRCP
jgi:hypothetical protein